MGPGQTYKLFHHKGNQKQNEKTTYRWGENSCKWCHRWGLNFQNMQTAHAITTTTKYQPSGKVGRRPKQTFLQRRYIDGHSVQFTHSVVSDSLRPHELQHTRPPCPSPTPGVHSNSSPSSRWCHPAISSSVIPFFSCPQSLPASGSFPISWLLESGGQSIGASASASVLPMNIQDRFPSVLTGLISLLSKGLSIVFSSITIWRHQFFSTQPFLLPSYHIHTWLLKKSQLWRDGPL